MLMCFSHISYWMIKKNDSSGGSYNNHSYSSWSVHLCKMVLGRAVVDLSHSHAQNLTALWNAWDLYSNARRHVCEREMALMQMRETHAWCVRHLVGLHGTKELFNLPPLVLKARHLAKWLCLLLGWLRLAGQPLHKRAPSSLVKGLAYQTRVDIRLSA